MNGNHRLTSAIQGGLATIRAKVVDFNAPENKKYGSRKKRPVTGGRFASGGKVSVEVNGDWYGVGGQVRALSQFVARMVSSVDDPKTLLDMDPRENPIIAYAQGRLSPFSSFALASTEYATGEKLNVLPFDSIDNYPDLAKFVGSSGLPFAVQAILENDRLLEAFAGAAPGGDPMRPGDIAAGLGPALAGSVGARSSVQTPTEGLRKAARDKYDVEWDNLTDQQRIVIEGEHPDLVKAREDFGSLSERHYRVRLHEVDQEFQASERASFNNLQGGLVDAEEFRTMLEDTAAKRFIQRQEAQRDYGIDIPAADTPKQKLLTAFYKTYDTARLPGTDKIDWERLEEAQASLQLEIDAGEYGDPTTADLYIEERKLLEHDPSVQWFFDNKKVIDEAGYWQAREAVFAASCATLARYVFEA